MNQGWIKIYRCLTLSVVWQNLSPTYFKVFMALLLLAAYNPSEIFWEGKRFTLKPGQLITSLDALSHYCGNVSIQNIRTALKQLEAIGTITQTTSSSGRLITIANWDTYQTEAQATTSDINKLPTSLQQKTNKQPTTYKKEKNKKNSNNRFNNFQQRDYDYAKLEQDLLRAQDEPSSPEIIE